MEFLTPAFAAVGALAASIPIVLHMLRRAPTQQMPFSLVRFLKPSQPKLTKRSNIEHWPLMLLRILALVLIGCAFGRPFQREVVPLPGVDNEARAVTILIDNSASMRRDGIADAVKKTVREVVDSLNTDDRLNVALFSDRLTSVLSADDWAVASAGERESLIDEILNNYEPDWMTTNLGSAMLSVAEDLAQETKDRRNVRTRTVVLVSDFQRGSRLDELKSGGWPANVGVDLKLIEPNERGNVGLSFVQDQRLDRIRLRLSSAGDTTEDEYVLRILNQNGDVIGDPVDAKVAPGQRRSLMLPTSFEDVTGNAARVELVGDTHAFDNAIDLPAVENPVVRVAHVGPAKFNDPESMRYYLQRVLSGNVERQVELIDLQKEKDVLLPVPDDVQFVVATAAIPDGLAKSLTQFFDRSGTLLLAAPDVAAIESLQNFVPTEFTTSEADVEDYAMFASLDYQHPLFAPFSEARFADFSSIRFWKHRDIDLAQNDDDKKVCRVIAKFDSGSPALIDITTGRGRILLLTSGWHPTDSQLALSTRFPPLLTQAFSMACPVQRSQRIQTVGETVDPQQMVSADDWTITTPSGERITKAEAGDVAAAKAVESDGDRDVSTFRLTEPGRYLISGTDADGTQTTAELIAAMPISESRTEPLPTGQLEVLGVGVKSDDGQLTSDETDPAVAGQLKSAELEDRQKWWRLFLLAGLILLIVESFWAAAIEQRQIAEA